MNATKSPRKPSTTRKPRQSAAAKKQQEDTMPVVTEPITVGGDKDEVVAVSTHSRIDWNDPWANENVHKGMPITVLRTTDGKWLAVEGTSADTIAEPVTLVQHMASSDLRRRCVVWATWDGVKKGGFWEMTPMRMPLYTVAPTQ